MADKKVPEVRDIYVYSIELGYVPVNIDHIVYLFPVWEFDLMLINMRDAAIGTATVYLDPSNLEVFKYDA